MRTLRFEFGDIAGAANDCGEPTASNAVAAAVDLRKPRRVENKGVNEEGFT